MGARTRGSDAGAAMPLWMRDLVRLYSDQIDGVPVMQRLITFDQSFRSAYAVTDDPKPARNSC